MRSKNEDSHRIGIKKERQTWPVVSIRDNYSERFVVFLIQRRRAKRHPDDAWGKAVATCRSLAFRAISSGGSSETTAAD